MAKKQTFADKSSRAGADADKMSVKVISAIKTDKGTYRFNERFIKVANLNEVEKVARGK